MKDCIYPDWEGIYIKSQHITDKDGFCIVCGNKREDKMINDKKLIYLAGPYWHEDAKVRSKRFKLYTKLAANLKMNKDVYVFSPITLGHPIAQVKGFDIHYDWLPLCKEILKPCDELWVVDLDGWKESKGTQAEITEAELLSKPIKMVTKRGKVSKFKYEAN